MQKLKEYIKFWPTKSALAILSPKSLYIKSFLIMSFVFLVMILGSSYLLGKNVEQTHIAVVKEELRSIAAIAAFYIDGDLVEQLQRPEQEGTEPYDSLQKMLIRTAKHNKKIDDVYIMRKGANQNELAFVANAYTIGYNHVALGETYDISQAPEMAHGFIEPVVDQAITTDKWGQMLSGYAPVKNSKGKVVGILGIDFAADDIRNAYKNRSRSVLRYLIFGMLILSAFSIALTKKTVERLNNIKNAIDMLLEEKFDISIRDAGKDEIKTLASHVNRLIKKMVIDQEQTFFHSTIGLVKALEAKDPYTHGHSSEVAAITDDIMNELPMDHEQQFMISFAAVLHDIGKIGISDMLLHKSDRLTDEEFSIIKQHPVIGEKILEGIPALDEIRDIVRHHHERYDGKGYPDMISGDQIHFGARIIAVADSFQAMISDRPYRKGMAEEAALQELKRNKGTQFDPDIVDVFLKICQNRSYKESRDQYEDFQP